MLIIYDFIYTEIPQLNGTSCRSRTNYIRPLQLGQLNCVSPHSAGRTCNKHPLSCCKSAVFE
ncbi:hypothetical protein D3C75_1153080 [compost metagenome]